MNTESTVKATCSCCKRRKSVLDLVTVSKRKMGSYNRAGSNGSGKVCRDCTIVTVESWRALRYRDDRVWGVYINAGGIMWSTACDHFGIDYSDLPKNHYCEQSFPARFKARKVGA